eukprot:Pgem_evm2s8015
MPFVHNVVFGWGFVGLEWEIKKVASSVKSVASIFDLSWTISGKSLMNRMNKIGPNINPCPSYDD